MRSFRILAAASLGLLGLAAGPPPSPPPDPLAASGWTVSSGAAPGYVDDRACAHCHGATFESYGQVGMARSFYRPRPENLNEDFTRSRFVHEPSGQHFEMRRDGAGLTFRRWQEDAAGRPLNVFEAPVEWILGSGNHARTYLFRAPGGEVYQLPVAWYSQEGKWAMAPGFDRPDHEGVMRRVRRECMFCHNGYPEVPAGSDTHGQPQTFPPHLPEGTGCQRCHGPGAEHARAMMGGSGSAAIANPGRLPPERRDEVCYQCHLQPSVSLPGVRRFGRTDYSFRPGEAQADYQLPVDVVQGNGEADRFEINHHPYRLRQSRCFTASDGKLSCLTCHDPHRKVPEAERAAHYRAACLGCHGPESCPAETAARAAGAPPGDCAGCHLPKRRPQDVVHVVMTDHKIQRPPAGADYLAPRAELDPVLLDVRFYDPATAPSGELGELYRAATVVRAAGTRSAVDFLAKKLAALRPAEPEPWLDLLQGQLGQRLWPEAERTARDLLARRPDPFVARDWLAIALAGQGRVDEALAEGARALEGTPDRPEARFNLGLLLHGRGRHAEALRELERAIALRPNFPSAWLYLGRARRALEQRDEAIAAFRRTLEIEPRLTPAYLELAESLLAAGQKAEALRYLEHGARWAARPAAVREALERVRADAAPPPPASPPPRSGSSRSRGR
ncbi:MAG TPA: tetratricopeptide repeat protein [Thermoanaerobaculia bacterium]|nr:tetratricopeptide repeat protein [Thermoanaerobaculia bacterium]